MTIQDIENKITEEANKRIAQIETENKKEMAKLDKFHQEQKQAMQAGILREAEQKAQSLQRSILVPARMKASKAILEEKQKYISQVYDQVQKEKKLTKADLEKLRELTEIKVAQILYG